MDILKNTVHINSRLEKETLFLSILKDRVGKYHTLMTSMSTTLTALEKRLGKLEQTALPVYNETKYLQKRQQNLQSTLQYLEKILLHYDASQEVCQLIHHGPSEGNIAGFLEALDKLKIALDYFLSNNSQSVELENVTSLFNTGCESLNNHFKLMLKKYSLAMKPIDLLDLIYIEEDSSNEDCSSFGQIPKNIREELNVISQWLEQNLRHEYMDIYSNERSDVVCRSLQNLKDHQKSGSWSDETFKPKYIRQEVKRGTSTRLQQIFERKANKMIQRATQTIEQSTGFSLKKSTVSSDHQLADECDNSDQELDKYIVLLLGFQKLLVREKTLLRDVIPPSKHKDVFSKLTQNSIDLIVKDAEVITNRIMKNIARKEWSLVLGIFSALKRVTLLQPDIEKTCDDRQREQLAIVLNKLQQTGLKALDQFLEMFKGDNTTNIVGMSTSTLTGYSNVPKDATVHELTSNTIWFIENLYDNLDVIGGILQIDPVYCSQLDAISTKKLLSLEEKNKALLAIYIKRVLAELNLTLMNKCEQYNDLAAKHLFRLNNIYYILKSLQRSNILDLVAIAEPDCEKRYVDMIGELKITYQKSWTKLLSNIYPIDELPRVNNGKVKEKEKAILKEKFSNFNKDFEDACRIQRSISVPDVILRECLKRDNAEHILPKYNQFFDIYADVSFSKNPEKYVKYKPHEVSAMLNKLFDDSAI